MMLLIDVGNTRIKWAIHADGVLGPQHAQAHAGWSLENVRGQIFASVARPDRVIVSNVGGPRLASLLVEAATQVWGLQPTFVQATAAAAGIRSAYAEPGKLGVDRWLGMIAAHDMVPAAVCVVSIGTAMTIDGLDANGAHLGGLITPGPQLMVRSLLGGTSDIAARAGAVQPTDALFATDTGTAIHNGARHALAALIVHASQRIAEQVNDQPTLVLTGGASALIETLVTLDHKTIPDLVLRGLAVLAKSS